MNTPIIYRILEGRMLTYEDYKNKPVEAINEPLVSILGSMALSASIIREDARPITGNQTYVREGVYKRLYDAAHILNERYPGYSLDVGYGYRALSVQTKRFKEALARVPDTIVDEEARKAVAHRQVAVPEVAGHPAGAAVDLRVLREGEPLDFGTNLWDYDAGKKIYTHSPEVSGEARSNRYLLRSVMCKAGFAPFDGEWWHFSYGDKEWAAYYCQPAALYDQIEFRAPELTDALADTTRLV